ncbi:MAG: hypothetical protein KC594_19115, partial [Nitrospira sp.]|nr:hypothetical protein [Nitrospira sp.]
DDWQNELYKRYDKKTTRQGDKTVEQVVNDVWHLIFSFGDQDLLVDYAQRHLQLNEEEAKAFAQPLKQDGYSNLSLCALNKIIPHMERDLIYSHATFLANLPRALKGHIKDWEQERPEIERLIQSLLESHRLDVHCSFAARSIARDLDKKQQKASDAKASAATWEGLRQRIRNKLQAEIGAGAWAEFSAEVQDNYLDAVYAQLRNHETQGEVNPVATIMDKLVDLLCDRYGIPQHDPDKDHEHSSAWLAIRKKLYHPSAIELYPPAKAGNDGQIRLGSPRIPSIKNPVFMRTMTQLRHLINAMLNNQWIDQGTRIHVEMARDLNTANERNAIYREQREREKEHEAYRKAIEEEGFRATDTDILKYRLWLEQQEHCIYTNKKIGLTQLLGDNPVYDIEHTLPRSLVLDNSQENLTLCDRSYNRDVKRNRIPSQLPEAEAIAERARKLWQEKIDGLELIVAKRKKAGRSAVDKEVKDKARSEFHYYSSQLRYWKGKLRRFEMTEINEGFTKSQLVDTRII